MDELYYCGFNGFRQVPSQPDKQTITTLATQGSRLSPSVGSKGSYQISDVSVCWNYLAVAETAGCGVVKYGLVDGKPGHRRIGLPPGGSDVRQISATPRHLLAVTELGECWAHEESKGWRLVNVNAESRGQQGLQGLQPAVKDGQSQKDAANLIDLGGSSAPSSRPSDEGNGTSGAVAVRMSRTSCGDAHNLGLDSEGRAYSLPSPLDFDPGMPRGTGGPHRVTDVVCGKEHSLLLTEHGQVFSWGGGSRGQLGHGVLSSEERPRLVMALDGTRVRKIAAGGWHSACVSQHDDLYMFGWNESGQLAQPANLTKPAECFSAVEKLFMACCTMQPDYDYDYDAAAPMPSRGGPSSDGEVYRKVGSNLDDCCDEVNCSDGGSQGVPPPPEAPSSSSTTSCGLSLPSHQGFGLGALTCKGQGCSSSSDTTEDRCSLQKDKDSPLTCYTSTSCNADPLDIVTVQSLPVLVTLPSRAGGAGDGMSVKDVRCGSRHTVVLTRDNQLWSFGWNKYGQLGIGHNHSRDCPEKMSLPKAFAGKQIKMLRCGDWGTSVVISHSLKR